MVKAFFNFVYIQHAIFSRVLLKIESQTEVEANNVSLKRFVCHFRVSCLIRIRHYWISEPFSHPQLLPSSLPPSRGDHLPPDARTARLFGRLLKSAHSRYADPVFQHNWSHKSSIKIEISWIDESGHQSHHMIVLVLSDSLNLSYDMCHSDTSCAENCS